ncbi:hypothetical protein HMPREF3169_09660 [Corynebacterium sp. HMSC08C04]|uniref:hypothetical protein n=1 Tax=Corynebacterium sp. HMSC08C04 TaxID=1581137 RepID=UPI0008A2F4CF|nr:hypothetical protein [Corynebacterium sp. HMSC08C04]OFT32790.1 hypothetical protein HMPREF3169_09660 [Corynebacterium sp. HMSC08C04]
MYPLIADGGELTVLRSLAAFSYGQWKVDWPDTVPEDQRPKLDDDRDFGYAARLKSEPGRMGRRFVRSDVSINAAEYTPEGVRVEYTGSSDVEQVLDEAASRTDGEAFFEQDIERAGLGSLVPYVDFDVDDVVPVQIWGRVLDAPVTSIEAVSQLGGVVDWRVHVGGSLLVDDAARLRSNDDLMRAIVQERRERAKAVDRAVSKASTAVATANSANSKSDKALKAATDADGTIESKLAEYRRLVAKFDADVVVNSQAADDMRQAAESYASSVAAAKVDTERYASLVANSKVIQSAVESAAADAKRASGEVSSLINAPDGEFRKGVAKFTEFQAMVNDKQSAWNVGIQKTLDAQSDVNAKQRQVNEVQADVNNKQQLVNQSQQQVNATQANINRQQSEINTAQAAATAAAQQTASDAKSSAASAKTASDKSLQVSTGLVKAQQMLEDTQLVQGNAIFWQEVHRTRVFYKYSMTTTDTYDDVMTITPVDLQRKMRMDFVGNWAGRVMVEARMTDAWGNNSRIDFFTYEVSPGNRRLIVEPEVANYGVNRMHVTIEQWWPNAPMEFVFVPNGSGGWQKPPYEDSIYGGISKSLLNRGIMLVWWVRGKPYVASRDVFSSPDNGATRKFYRAGAVLPQSGTVDGMAFTGITPVSGDTRPVRLVEQL